MKKIAYLTNAPAQSGVGYRAAKIANTLHHHYANQFTLIPYFIDGKNRALYLNQARIATQAALPPFFKSKTISWIQLGHRVRRYLRTQPTQIWHATNQTLSFITAKHHPSLVTVHDLIELQEPQSRFGSLAARYLYRGIKRADQIIAVSRYSAKQLQATLGVNPDKITVIPNGVDADFHPISNFANSIGAAALRQELKISPSAIIVLLVSSDHPRKNSLTALRAFVRARQQDSRLVFVKVGAAGLPAGREQLLAEIDRLKVRPHVRIVQDVTIERLNDLYNLASVLIFPSRAEGFGLPPLQAMAAGTPVVAAGSTSIPEVVGQAGVLYQADDIDSFTRSITKIIGDASYAAKLRAAGLKRAALFSWERAAAAEAALYQRI